MNDDSKKLTHQLCANPKCGHERSKHWNGICYARVPDPPFACLCANFEETAPAEQEPSTENKNGFLSYNSSFE